jgi:hypothetical protein
MRSTAKPPGMRFRVAVENAFFHCIILESILQEKSESKTTKLVAKNC